MSSGSRQPNFVVPVAAADAVAPLWPDPGVGRRFAARRRVRIDAVDVSGRMRFDGIARVTQDIAADDSADSGLPTTVHWVVRRTVIDIVEPIRFREMIDLLTFCSGIGRGWAERRIAIRGDRGGRVEVAATWVALDPETGAPRRIPDGFEAVYGESAGGRKVRPTLEHGPPPSDAEEVPWCFRAVDRDMLDHVNNAVYWVPLEEVFGRGLAFSAPGRGEVEHRHGIELDEPIRVVTGPMGPAVGFWYIDADDKVRASIRWHPLPSGLY